MLQYYKNIWLDLGGTISSCRDKSTPLLPSLHPLPLAFWDFLANFVKDEKYLCVGSGKAETTYTEQQQLFCGFQVYSQLSCSTAEMFQRCKDAMP